MDVAVSSFLWANTANHSIRMLLHATAFCDGGMNSHTFPTNSGRHPPVALAKPKGKMGISSSFAHTKKMCRFATHSSSSHPPKTTLSLGLWGNGSTLLSITTPGEQAGQISSRRWDPSPKHAHKKKTGLHCNKKHQPNSGTKNIEHSPPHPHFFVPWKMKNNWDITNRLWVMTNVFWRQQCSQTKLRKITALLKIKIIQAENDKCHARMRCGSWILFEAFQSSLLLERGSNQHRPTNVHVVVFQNVDGKTIWNRWLSKQPVPKTWFDPGFGWRQQMGSCWAKNWADLLKRNSEQIRFVCCTPLTNTWRAKQKEK